MYEQSGWSRFSVTSFEQNLLGGFVSGNRPDVFILRGEFHKAVLTLGNKPARQLATAKYDGLLVDAVKFQQEGFADKPEIQFRTMGAFQELQDNGEALWLLTASDYREWTTPEVIAFPKPPLRVV